MRVPAPLHIAAYCGHEVVVAALLAKGARVDTVDKDGDSPLGDAKQKGHAKVVALLEAHK